MLLSGAGALTVVLLDARGLTSVIAVTESGLITIMTGLPLLSFARTRNELRHDFDVGIPCLGQVVLHLLSNW